MIDALGPVLESNPRIAYALLFGSVARARAHAHSDVDVAIGLAGGEQLSAMEIGALTSELESAAGKPVHLVLLDEAPPGLAYRIFRDGRPILTRDSAALKARWVRAVLEYLDFQPFEEIFTRGVLRAQHGR